MSAANETPRTDAYRRDFGYRDEYGTWIQQYAVDVEDAKTLERDLAAEMSETDALRTELAAERAKRVELEENEREYERILGPKSHQELADEIAELRAKNAELDAKHLADLELVFRDHDLDVKDLATWRERAESAEARLKEALAALRELVACKDLKEAAIRALRHRVSAETELAEYERRQPLAWAAARAIATQEAG